MSAAKVHVATRPVRFARGRQRQLPATARESTTSDPKMAPSARCCVRNSRSSCLGVRQYCFAGCGQHQSGELRFQNCLVSACFKRTISTSLSRAGTMQAMVTRHHRTPLMYNCLYALGGGEVFDGNFPQTRILTPECEKAYRTSFVS